VIFEAQLGIDRPRNKKGDAAKEGEEAFPSTLRQKEVKNRITVHAEIHT
jgi:hypothetical protein